MGIRKPRPRHDELDQHQHQDAERERPAAKTRRLISGVWARRLHRQNSASARRLARKSRSTGALVHPEPEARLVAKIRQAKPRTSRRYSPVWKVAFCVSVTCRMEKAPNSRTAAGGQQCHKDHPPAQLLTDQTSQDGPTAGAIAVIGRESGSGTRTALKNC